MQKKATEEVNIENKDKVNVNDTFEEENIKYKYVVKITKLNKVRTVTYINGTVSKKITDTKTT